MGKDIRHYNSRDWRSDSSEMVLAEFAGGRYGKSIQFQIGNKYALLSEVQLLDLLTVVSRRLAGHESNPRIITAHPMKVEGEYLSKAEAGL